MQGGDTAEDDSGDQVDTLQIERAETQGRCGVVDLLARLQNSTEAVLDGVLVEERMIDGEPGTR